jgi:hypothetical protein
VATCEDEGEMSDGKEEEIVAARELLLALRGNPPSKCDWCGKECPPDELHPEEAGQWVCLKCFESNL